MTTDTERELQDPDAWDWESAESRPGRKPQSTTTASGEEALKYVSTETERETELVTEPPPRCTICGSRIDVRFGSQSITCCYTRNTCSQECARTAAIVEAIDRFVAALTPRWYVHMDDKGHQTVKMIPPYQRPVYDPSMADAE